MHASNRRHALDKECNKSHTQKFHPVTDYATCRVAIMADNAHA